ncbi:DUF5605 domain-containing protein [Paenibacillus caseinilyticus]|uniref:DUF5060 domain-containing protein n=1 Tax=Paenibacillus mucilaginosus K02 TaxID=997761 RepID=I0BKM0_9BACL|nr:DUF5060 domain-containing protein [Paenibacillus mucilaginosus]AFH62917.1 hypothetical protein B2K_19740 [Paenibacillus mucilaginosus K02]
MNMVNEQVEQWGVFELRLEGPDQGNPYRDCPLQAAFRFGGREVKTAGFYDGGGMYRIRFMPDRQGEWRFETSSPVPELDGISGSFVCTPPSAGNHGPVRVMDEYRFAHEDGTVFHPFGTTCYAWIHLNQGMQEKTLQTLADNGFNKLRMCVFPKHYAFNSEEPDSFPFARRKDGGFDHTRFDPAFFAKLERRILDLQKLGIEADLILFHPYDKGHWGFDRMDAEVDDSYLSYVLARLSAFRNVWWSLANEYDFMEEKKPADWDRLFRIVQEEDPYGHPRSIHNGTRMYDHGSVRFYDHAKPWVTHLSVQHWDVTLPPIWRREYHKPIVIDECCYEGNLPQRWGNITAEEMTRRFWESIVRGAYCTHGETYTHPDNEIWWAKGGRLYGQSPERITFLKSILEEAPAGYKPIPGIYDVPTIGVEGEYYLQYFGIHRPSYREIPLPEDAEFTAEIIDTWEMTITKLDHTLRGRSRLQLPDQLYTAVRIQRVR